MGTFQQKVKGLAAKLEPLWRPGAGEDTQEAMLDLLALCQNSTSEQLANLDSSLSKDISGPLLALHGRLKNLLVPVQRTEGRTWMYEDDYANYRSAEGLTLDLLGYFPSPEVESALLEALDIYRDPKLKFFPIVGLLRRGMNVRERDVFEVAADGEMRNWLYERLQELGKLSLIPPVFRTQEALAESAMVDWLVYPTELNGAPDEIELMEVFSESEGPKDEDTFDYYVFRFRTYPPHWAAEKGWMAGVAGPYCRAEMPTTKGYGFTFSKFEPWDSKTAERHLEDVIDRATSRRRN